MKIFIISSIGFLLICRFSDNKAAAIVEKKEGIYVFVFCKPASEYDYLGSVKKNIAWTGQTTEMLNSMIKKTKKEYPNANAIVFTSDDMDRADAVIIK